MDDPNSRATVEACERAIDAIERGALPSIGDLRALAQRYTALETLIEQGTDRHADLLTWQVNDQQAELVIEVPMSTAIYNYLCAVGRTNNNLIGRPGDTVAAIAAFAFLNDVMRQRAHFTVRAETVLSA